MKVAIYSRKSKFTGSGESIQNQIDLCKEYAHNHFENIDKFIIFEDEGFSGGNTNRPEYQRMIKAALNGKFDVLMCYRLDRISRNISDFTGTIEKLQSKDIAFISLREQFDTSTPMGRAMMYIASVFAQLERETIAERIKDNMLQLARTGRWLGGNLPMGFKSEPIVYLDENLKEKKMFKLSPIKEELEVVKLILNKYLELQSLSKLECYCLQNHITTKLGNNFHKHSLRFILTNPVYATADEYIYDYFNANNVQVANSKNEFNGKYGIMAYNKKLVKKGQSVKNKDISEWICAVGKHKGILPGKYWVMIQNILDVNKCKAPRQGTSNAAMLSGLIKCNMCGSFMKIKYGQIQKRTYQRLYYYVCNMKDISKNARCQCPNLPGEKTDRDVISSLKHMIHSGIIKDIDQLKEELNDKANINKQIISKIRENKKSITNLLQQLSMNNIESVSQYIFEEIEKLDKENKNLERKLEIDRTDMEKFNLDTLKESLIQFREQIDTAASITEKRNLITSVVDKIVWNGEELKISLLNF